MKTYSIFLTVFFGFFFCMEGNCSQPGDLPAGAGKTLQIKSAPGLNGLVNSWTKEYSQVEQGINFTVVSINDPAFRADDGISFVPSDFSGVLAQEPVWKMVVGKDAIVPVINAKNPWMNEISAQGLTPGQIGEIFSASARLSWGKVVKGAGDAPVRTFLTGGEAFKAKVAGFTGVESGVISSQMTASAEELLSAVEKDLYAVGFCKMADIVDMKNNSFRAGIKILPIDRNRNGKIDYFENIYDNPEAFTRGVWIGKFPKVLCDNIYAVSATKPEDQATLAFLGWIISGGQQFLALNGYSDLTSPEKEAGTTLLTGISKMPEQPVKPYSAFPWGIVLMTTLVAAAIVYFSYRIFHVRKAGAAAEVLPLRPALHPGMVTAPKGLYYDKTHTWAFMETEGMVKVGVDDFLQHVTGTLSRIKMKKPGEMVRKGEKIMTLIRNGKQLNLYSPVSGVIAQNNPLLASDVTTLHSSPYTDGWVYLIEPRNWEKDIRYLFMGEKYKEWLKDEFARLKEFFTVPGTSASPLFARAVLQDGGELADQVLADMEPEVWEEFQVQFLDKSI